MRKLLAKIALLSLLVSLPYALPFAVLWLSGEITPVSQVVREQMEGRHLVYYAPVYSEPRMLFKLQSAQARRPEVLVMGTSRVGQIRSEFFRQGVSFYNAGMATETLSDYRVFLEHLPQEHLPKVVMAGLDQRYFNPNDRPAGSFEINVTQASSPKRVPLILFAKWRQIYADYRDGKFRLATIWQRHGADPKLVGLRAVILGDGFRNDGSFYYCLNTIEERRNLEGKRPSGFSWPGLTDLEKRRNLEAGLSLIDKGVRFSDFGGEVSPESLVELERLASFCRQRNIHLIPFLPPFTHLAYERIKANGNHGFMFKLPTVAGPILERYGFALHDFSDLGALGIPDSQAFDLVHPTEKGMLRLFLRLAESDTVLPRYCDASALHNLLSRTDSDFSVFEN
jgi:hypothetical protein